MNANQLNYVNKPSARPESGWRVTIFVVSIVLFSIAVLATVVGLNWRSWFPGAEGQSFLGGVRGATYTLIAHIQ
jgi:hypothetical protein